MKSVIRSSVKKLIPRGLRPMVRAVYARSFYFGLRHACPFCESRLRRFLPGGLTFPVLEEKRVIGGGFRTSASCPVCGCLDRERLVYLYLKHKTDILQRPQRVLHVAPERTLSGVLSTQTSLEYLTADLYAEGVMVKMDITDIQFPDGSFDAIICNHVLEHIIDDHAAMCELYRTLKVGGWAILQVPLSLTLDETYEDASITGDADREQAFGQWDHVRIYADDYKGRLERAGFEVEILEWRALSPEFGARDNRFGLLEDERLFVVHKSAE